MSKITSTLQTIPMQPQKQSQSTHANTFIDSHTHLLDYDRQSRLSLQQILKEAEHNNLTHIASNTCCSNQFPHMLKLAKLSTSSLTIIPCYGIHPCYICEQLKEQNSNWKQMLKQYLTSDPLAHVGEIGLDFRKDVIESNPQDRQWEFFQQQFQIAVEFDRAVTIHCVRAYGEILKYFKKWNSKLGEVKNGKQTKKKGGEKTQKQEPANSSSEWEAKKKPTIILHSYGGSKQITKSLLKLTHLGIYFSLSLKHSPDLPEVIPLEQLLLQTDSPYQNDHPLLVSSNFRTQQQLQEETAKYQQLITSQQHHQTQLLKESKFFNKHVLDNRPANVVANYRQMAKTYKVEMATLVQVVGKNAMIAFKLIK